METEMIGACGHDLKLAGRHGVRVDGVLQPRRGAYVRGGFLICSHCWADSVNPQGFISGDAPVNELLNRLNYGNSNRATGLYGGAVTTGVQSCAGCGLPVERGANPRTKHHTCSRRCTVRVAKGVSTAVTPKQDDRACPICQGAITGRVDKRYCSDRCRQQAHRRQPPTPERRAELQRALAKALNDIQALFGARSGEL